MNIYSFIPTAITWFRVISIPLFIIVFFSGLPYTNWLAFAIFLIVGISDGIDGWLARRWQVTSEFGAFLDPIADKLAVCSALILIASTYESTFIIVASVIIIGREMVISALREWCATSNFSYNVPVSFWGKLKTVIQFNAICFLLIAEPVWMVSTLLIGNILLAIAVILSLFSMSQYFWFAYKTSKK